MLAAFRRCLEAMQTPKHAWGPWDINLRGGRVAVRDCELCDAHEVRSIRQVCEVR